MSNLISSKILLSIVVIAFGSVAYSNNSETTISREKYIDTWKNEAILQMKMHKIPASITLAQGILESGNGNSDLAKYANNHFGIKCHGWEGATVYKDDDKKDECFRSYETAHESFEDHSAFLTKRGRYSFLFDYKITDYKAWAKGLKKAGYATNPKYPALLINLIETNKLYLYDQLSEEELLAMNSESIEETEEQSPLFNVNVGIAGVNTHMVGSNNKVRYITAKEGDTFYKIAKEFELGLWQLYKYNDLGKKDILLAGDKIYLQPKRSKSKKKSSHKVKKGENMRSISQDYGIKLKKLYRMNDVAFGSQVLEGDVIQLK